MYVCSHHSGLKKQNIHSSRKFGLRYVTAVACRSWRQNANLVVSVLHWAVDTPCTLVVTIGQPRPLTVSGLFQEKEHRVSIGSVFVDRLTRRLLTMLTYTEGAMLRDRIRQRLWRSFSDIIKVLSALDIVLRVWANCCVGPTDSSNTNRRADARHSDDCASQITWLIEKQFHWLRLQTFALFKTQKKTKIHFPQLVY
jgi:hypothetical protein